jgi:hypothetical protein
MNKNIFKKKDKQHIVLYDMTDAIKHRGLND